MVPKYADNSDPNSLASRLRRKRNQRFVDAVARLQRPLRILDVGGRQDVWETIGFVGQPDIEIVLLNAEPTPASYPNVTSILGDARNMTMFRDAEFDVVYSNSVIEHVGEIDDMRRMADEIRRVGKRYFLQTPYLYFPIEPHFVFPLFQFLPISLRIYLVQRFSLGWMGGRIRDQAQAERAVRSVVLLSKRQLRSLFPEADLATEKFYGLTKSLLATRF